MKFAIVTDTGRTHPYVHMSSLFKDEWPKEVVTAAKRYQVGTDAIDEVDLFTLFTIIGEQDLAYGHKIYALLNAGKKILIFAPRTAVKILSSKQKYIDFIFKEWRKL